MEYTDKVKNGLKKILIILTAAVISACSASYDEQTAVREGIRGHHITGNDKDTGPVVVLGPVRTKNPGFVINAWGDSITAGVNGGGISYPSVLEKLTGIRTNNFGVPGETSREITDRVIRYGDQSKDVMIIQMGDNGGWKDINDLIRQYRELIRGSGTDRYIIITSTDDPDDLDQIWGYTFDYIGLNETKYEKALREAFGEHVFEGRQYLILNGLRVCRLSETNEDRLRAMKGKISLQLRNPETDNTHLNDRGYTALAEGIFEFGRNLGYW